MLAARFDAPRRLTLTELDDPVPREGQALIAVEACGICGSDLHVFHHGYGVPAGQVLGHEFSGRVVDAPGVDGLVPGDPVVVRPVIPCGACDRCRAGDVQLCRAPAPRIIGFGAAGAFAELVLVPTAIRGQTVFPLPSGVTTRAAALTEPLAVALHAVRLAGPVEGATALVLGAGAIGLGVVRFLRLRGAGTIIAADPSALRRGRALELGADAALDPAADDVVVAVRERTGPWALGRGARADVTFDCAGAPGTLRAAIDATRQRGIVVIAAMGTTRVELRPDVIATKELVLRGSMAYIDEFGEVLARIADGSVDPERFVTHTFPLRDIQAAFETQGDADAAVKVLVTP